MTSPKKCYHAILREENGEFILKAGSILAGIEAPTLQPKAKRWRSQWKQKNLLKEIDQNGTPVLELKQDQKVPSLNFAQKIVQGNNSGGPRWKTK